MKDWKTINNRKKRYQRTRYTGKCEYFAFKKRIKEVLLKFKFSQED